MTDYIAEARNVHISPRKVRLVADYVSDMSLTQALLNLALLKKRAAIPLKKAIESAVANAVNNFKIEKDSLKIKEILVNEGIRYKRFHFASRGRTRPYIRRASHIRVVLSSDKKSVDEKVETAKTQDAKIALPARIASIVKKGGG